VINDATMPAGLFQSYARLFAAAWSHGYRRTEPLEFDSQLTPLLGLRRSQVRQHLQALRFAKLLDWSTDGRNRYVIRFAAAAEAPPPESGNPDSSTGYPDYIVDGVVENLENLSEEIQQHQQESGGAESLAPWPIGQDMSPGQALAQPGQAPAQGLRDSPAQGLRDSPAQGLRDSVEGYLLRAGVWPDVAGRLADQVAENEGRMDRQGGPRYLAGQADVLGWIAYCFADRQANKISQPAAVLAANLNANRRCPDEYRPKPVCVHCGCEEGYCECEQGPAGHFPAAYLERAFSARSRYTGYTESRWGVCARCHACPCQCGPGCAGTGV
jgi:hypothetical protein